MKPSFKLARSNNYHILDIMLNWRKISEASVAATFLHYFFLSFLHRATRWLDFPCIIVISFPKTLHFCARARVHLSMCLQLHMNSTIWFAYVLSVDVDIDMFQLNHFNENSKSRQFLITTHSFQSRCLFIISHSLIDRPFFYCLTFVWWCARLETITTTHIFYWTETIKFRNDSSQVNELCKNSANKKSKKNIKWKIHHQKRCFAFISTDSMH